LYNGKFNGTTFYGGLAEGYGILHRFGARKNDFAGSPGPNLYVLNGILYGTAGTSKHGWGTFTNSDGGAGNIWAYQGALYGTTRGGWMGKAPYKFVRGAFFEMQPLSLACWFRLRPPPPKGVGRAGVALTYEGSLYGISKWGGKQRAGGGTVLEVTP
jgi:hypothetical protein